MPVLPALRRWSVAGSGGGDVVRFASAHGLAAAGDAMVTVSLAGSLFFSVSPDASRRQVLLYLGLAMIPFLLIAPLVGPIIDRFPTSHRLLAVSCYSLRAAAATALAFFLLDLGLYPLALLALVLNKVSGVVKQAIVPTLVDDAEQLVAANSYLARVATVAGAAGGGVGAALIVVTGAWSALVGGTILFAGAAAAALRIRDAVAEEGREAAILEYRELHTPAIQATSNAFTALRAAVGFFIFGLAFALRRDSAPAWMYGAGAAAFGIATFAANVVSPQLRRRKTEPQLMAAALLALFVCAGFAAIGRSRSLTLLVAGILGLSAGVGRQAFDSLVQRRAPLALRGRAFARFETRFQLAWAAGGAAATALATSIQVSMAVIAIILAPTVVFYLRATVDDDRFGDPTGNDAVGRARRHFALATSLFASGEHAPAAIEAAAGVDSLIVGEHPLHPSVCGRANDLRQAAISGGNPAIDAGALRSLLADLDDLVATIDVRASADDGDGEISRRAPST